MNNSKNSRYNHCDCVQLIAPFISKVITNYARLAGKYYSNEHKIRIQSRLVIGNSLVASNVVFYIELLLYRDPTVFYSLKL